MSSSVETKSPKGICEHGRRKPRCKECGGIGLCPHGRIRSVCKECGGGSICEHGRVKSVCKECGGSGLCEHGRVKSVCKECGGSGSNNVPRGKKKKLDNLLRPEHHNRIENIHKELIFLKDIQVRSNLVLVGTKKLLLLQQGFK